MKVMPKPRNFASIELPGSGLFQARCDGERLEVRVNDGPWQWVAMPAQDDDDPVSTSASPTSDKETP